MRKTRQARCLLVFSVLYVTGFYFAGSAMKPGYSQLANFVSEYNATGTAAAGVLSYAGFLASTLLLSGFLLLASPLIRVSGPSRLGFWLLWSLPASFLVGFLAPCDAGCPLAGSTSQVLHNLFAVVTYLGMGAGIALVALAPGLDGRWMARNFMLATGLVFPVVFFAMVDTANAPIRGLLQRLLDIGMAVSLTLLAWRLLHEPASSQSQAP